VSFLRPSQRSTQGSESGREVVHLSYHRLGVEAAAKDWEVSEVYMDIEAALAKFAILALPSRLDDKTREALQEPMEHDSAVGPASVATGERTASQFAAAPLSSPASTPGAKSRARAGCYSRSPAASRAVVQRSQQNTSTRIPSGSKAKNA
jgi:hypothetical protein